MARERTRTSSYVSTCIYESHNFAANARLQCFFVVVVVARRAHYFRMHAKYVVFFFFYSFQFHFECIKYWKRSARTFKRAFSAFHVSFSVGHIIWIMTTRLYLLQINCLIRIRIFCTKTNKKKQEKNKKPINGTQKIHLQKLRARLLNFTIILKLLFVI